MREAHGLQKAGEGTDVANPSLGAHLLVQIERRVRAQDIIGALSRHNQREQAVRKSRAQVEARDLRSHERVQRPDDRAAGQQVDPASAELARAGPGQHESAPVLRFNEDVDDVQQLGKALDLVDDNGQPVRCATHEIAQSFRPRGQFAGDVRQEQINDQGVG